MNQPHPSTVDTVMEAWQRDATPPTWAQIVAMKQEHQALTDLRGVAERKNGIIRTLYARIHKLEAALAHIHGVALADDPRDLPGIAKDAKQALGKKHEGT